ncbi:MAG TPA: TPM domain-containing protein [Gammaproteobacteria bacterium]
MAGNDRGNSMSPLSLFLGRMRGPVIATLLVLAPASAFSLTGHVAALSPSESLRGATHIADPHGRLHHEERARLEAQLGEFWRGTGVRVSVLVESPPNTWESLDSFSQRTAKKWNLAGSSEQTGGLLLVVDAQRRQAALSVSADLLREFPAGSIARIISGNVNPLLRRGELAGGISEGIKRIAAILEQSNRINHSLFARGYGALALFGLLMAGMMLRRKWGALRSATAAALSFGALVCFDGFTMGFPWYGVLFGAALSAFFLGLFVWVGLGNDTPTDTAKL